MKSGFLFQSFGSSPRWPSPRSRVSQRMTSAPNSQSTRATVGPAAPVVSSITRIPSKGNLDMTISCKSFSPRRPWRTDSLLFVLRSNHATGPERGDVVFCHAELGAEDLFVVLAEKRRGARDSAG